MAERQQIGRTPENPEAAVPVAELDWEDSGGRMSISLVTGDGQNVDMGTFPSAVVFPALMFAADGRPYVVSLEQAPPLFDRKVLLHPVLQDTALGCRLLQIDRLAGTLQERDDELARDIDRVESVIFAQQAVYELVWATRVMTAFNAMQKDEFGAGVLFGAQGWGSVRQSLSYADQIARAGADHLAPHWEELTTLRSGSDPLALLKAKPNYFHREVTSVADQCLAQSTEPIGFERCAVQASTESLFEMLDDGEMLWGAPPPRWEIAFGIGEVGYELTAELTAISNATSEPRTTFVAWIDFLSLPNFLQGTGAPWFSASNTAIVAYQDTQPFMLEALEAPLVKSIGTLFNSGPYWQVSREALEAFTTLQRFFRLGFDERYGPEFPIEQFTSMGDAFAEVAFSENYRTPRWLTQPDMLEQEVFYTARELDESSKLGNYDLLGQKAATCTALIAGSEVRSEITPAEWAAACDPEPLMAQYAELRGRPDKLDDAGYFVQQQVLRMIRLNYARKIRKELDVARDDGFDLTGEVCPAP